MSGDPKLETTLTRDALLGPDVPKYWQALACFVDRFMGVELNLQTLCGCSLACLRLRPQRCPRG